MKPDFSKFPGGLVPAIIQDARTQAVLMLGYMNARAFEKTCAEKRVTFFSRSRQRLWTKGESSGNFLEVKQVLTDCDNDTLLIQVIPAGPVCHTGAPTCFGEAAPGSFLFTLERIIQERKNKGLPGYTTALLQQGLNKVAQKVGEEAVELILEAQTGSLDRFRNEAADLMYHLLVLLAARETSLDDMATLLGERHAQAEKKRA